MSRQFLLALAVQALLMMATTLLLIRSMGRDGRSRVVASVSGYLMLFLTFCWSVVFGIMLTIQRLPLLN